MFASGNRLWLGQKARGREIILGFFWNFEHIPISHKCITKVGKCKGGESQPFPNGNHFGISKLGINVLNLWDKSLGNKIGPNWPPTYNWKVLETYISKVGLPFYLSSCNLTIMAKRKVEN